jgi:hypothetical protein
MSGKITYIIILSALLFFLLCVFSNSMLKPLSRDEHMYCTAGVLMSQGKTIYKDFSYIAQLPYHPLLLAGVYRITNTSHFLLTARVVSVICDFLTVFFLIAIYRRIFSQEAVIAFLLGFASAVLYLFNSCVDYVIGYAWNHDAVTLSVVISFWLFITTDFKSKSCLRVFFIGAILTLATCMRITTALIWLFFLIFILIKNPGSLKRKLRIALPYVFATVIVLIWPAWIIAQSPKSFFLNIYRIPSLNGKLLQEVGVTFNKFALTINSIARPEYLLLILIAIYLYSACLYYRKKTSNFDITGSAFAGLLVILFFLIAYIPPTIWIQYFAVPVPFLILSLAFPLRYLRQSSRIHFKSACILIIVCALIGLIENPFILARIPKLFKTDNWAALQVHKNSEQIARQIDKSKPVLTLAPLYALEGGCEIYSQLSAGSFVYRVAELMSDGELKATNTVGPKTLKKMIEKSPPSAILTGTEPEYFRWLEESLEKAAGPNWNKQSLDNGLTLFYTQAALNIGLI